MHSTYLAFLMDQSSGEESGSIFALQLHASSIESIVSSCSNLQSEHAALNSLCIPNTVESCFARNEHLSFYTLPSSIISEECSWIVQTLEKKTLYYVPTAPSVDDRSQCGLFFSLASLMLF